jgi:hypothetical protein
MAETKNRRAARPVRIEGELAYVTLTRGHEAVIDAADAADVGRYNWHVHGGYAARTERRDGQTIRVRLHNHLMRPGRGLVVDHIKGDRLDNRRANLRVVTPLVNNLNRRLSRNNTSGYRGVSRCPRCGRWRLQLTVRGRYKHVGCFDDKHHAAHCRPNAFRLLWRHGDDPRVWRSPLSFAAYVLMCAAETGRSYSELCDEWRDELAKDAHLGAIIGCRKRPLRA